MNTNTVLILILAAVTIAVLLQAGVLFGMFLIMRKAVQTAREEADAYRSKMTPIIEKVTPIIEKLTTIMEKVPPIVESAGKLIETSNDLAAGTKELIAKLRPQLESAADEIASLARDIHSQANQLQASVDDVAQKARHQVDRADGMVTSVFNGLDRFGSFLNNAVHVPIRQVNGVVAAAKAVVDTLRSPAPPRPMRRVSDSRRERPAAVGEDKDLFV